MSDQQARHSVLMSFSQTGAAGTPRPSDEMLADIIVRLMRIEALLKESANTSYLEPK